MTKHSGIFRQSDVGQAIADNNWVGTVPSSIEYLIVAGGGGGGEYYGGGAGAGGLLAGFAGITLGVSYFITVGAGGVYNTSGANSVFGATTSGATTGQIVALAGGGGGYVGSSGLSGAAALCL